MLGPAQEKVFHSMGMDPLRVLYQRISIHTREDVEQDLGQFSKQSYPKH